MRKLKIYLDTSVINFLFADDAPERKEITIDFFQNYVKKKRYDVYISPVVIDEINRTKNDKKRQSLLDAVDEYPLNTINYIEKDTEIKALAIKYINHGIIPAHKLEDALHIAITTIYNIDILVSWNYKHLANVNKERKILAVNITEGYPNVFKMATPLEVVYEEEN